MADINPKKQKSHRAGSETASAEKPQRTSVSIKKLLAGHDGSLDDKVATVKTAHHVDKSRFETAFKTLMSK
jgi:hypothetical protein